MEKPKINTPDSNDVKQFAIYYGKTFLYSFLIGSAVMAIVKNYKKAVLNEEVFSMYKYFRGIERSDNDEDLIC
jgi:hypothetical protein